MKKLVCTFLIFAVLSASLASCRGNAPSHAPGQPERTACEATLPDGPADAKGEYDHATFMYYTLNDDGASYTARPQGVPDVLEELVIPGEYKGLPVTEIDVRLNEHSIETVVISEGIKVISGGFDYCTDIKRIYIPASVVHISRGAFNCRATMGGHGHIKSNVIETIVVAEENRYYYVDGNCLIERSSQTLILGCNGSVIPHDGSVKRIGYAAFANCHGIETVVLPKSVIEIEYAAFDHCDSLKQVYITSSVSYDGRMVNLTPEAIFGRDATDILHVLDAESLELYEGLLGPYFSIGVPYDFILSAAEAKQLALTYWNTHNYWKRDPYREDPVDAFPFSVVARLDANAYRVDLSYFVEDRYEPLHSLVIDAYTGDVIESGRS